MADQLLTALETRLTAYKPNPVPLNAGTLQHAGQSVVDLFSAELGTPGLTLTGSASIGFDPDGVLVVGGQLTNQRILGMTNPAVTARFSTGPDPTAPASTILLIELTVATTSGWALATSFPNLAQAPALSGLTLDSAKPASFVLRSIAGPVDDFGPVPAAGLTLRLTVLANGGGALAGFAPVLLLPAGGSLALAGPAMVSATRESFAVRGESGATAPTLSISGLPAVTLDRPQPSIAGVATTPGASRGMSRGDTAWRSRVGISVYGVNPMTAGTTVALALDLPLDNGPATLRLAAARPVPFGQLLDFISGLSLLASIPDAIKNAVAGQLNYWILSLSGAAGQWRAAAVQLAVTMDEGWSLVPGVVELTTLQIGLTSVLPPTGAARTTGWVSGGLSLAGGAAELDVTVPLPVDSGDVVISAAPDYHVAGLGALAKLVGGVDLAGQLPDSVGQIGSFSLVSFSVQLNLGTLSVSELSVSLSADTWTVVPDRLVLQQLDIDLTVQTPFSSPSLSGLFAGVLLLGGVPIQVLVSRGGPDAPWLLDVSVEQVALPSIGALTQLAGADLSDTLPAPLLTNQLELNVLELSADLSVPAIRTFGMVVGTAAPWVVVAPFFSLQAASVGVTLDWTSGSLVYSGFLMAVLDFGDGDVMLGLQAELRPDKSWLLSGQLEQPVKLRELIQTGLGFTAPNGLLNIDVTALSLSYDTGARSYAFTGSASWTPSLPGLQLEVAASVSLSRQPIVGEAGTFAYSGRIQGDLKSHFGSNALAMSLAYEFQRPPEPPGKATVSYVFALAFNQLTLTGSYTTADNGDAVVTVQLGGITFGDIIEYLLRLADPTAPSVLSAPWDVLYKINFNDLLLVVNITQRTVGIKDTICLDLGLITIETVSLTYVSKGGSPTVDIALTGQFLGQSFADDDPLGWDLLNEDPPAVPGAGAALLDLQDLGVGQHLVLAPGATTMPDVLAKLHDIIAATEGQPKPWETLKFDPLAGWLIGAKFTVMDTLTLGIVFSDPVMYGAQLSLAGAKAGPFDGLVFEILYCKISADVGVYHVELQLPTLMRHLEFGAVSVTLPSLVLDIYTDGGFYVDFGFPYNNDWSVCFGLQIFPFVGAGGFYLGRLTSADGGAGLTPQISNGTFGPIIEFGVALAVGVGKDISEGPLSAGVSVTVQGILTGVVAWFNPTDHSAPSDRYYRIDGSLAIVGKLYGSVDFKVLSVSIAVTASVTASIAIEAYGPIHLGISVDVEVQAGIKILFIRIHFTFTLHLDASFTIGSQQPTPWTLGAPAGRPGITAGLPARRRMEGGHHELRAARFAMLAASPPGLQWTPVPVMTKAIIDVTLLPVFTVAPDPDSGIELVTITLTPIMQSTPPPTSSTPVSLTMAAPQSFDLLVEALIKWGMRTLIGATAGPITAVDLLLIYEDLTAPDISQRGFDYTDLANFLADNLVFALAAPDPKRPTSQELSAAILPMPPPLTMTPDGRPAVDFSQAPQVDQDYQNYVQQILNKLVVNYDYDRAPDPASGSGSAGAYTAAALADGVAGRVRTMLRAGGEPITDALFADWLLMVARSSVQLAINELKASHYNAFDPGQSLATLAATMAPSVAYTVRTGDTVAAIAALFGINAAALTAVNGRAITPGQQLTVPPPMAVADYVTVPGDTLASLSLAWAVPAAAIEAANPVGTNFDEAGTAVQIPVPAALFALATANLATPLATSTAPIAGLVHAVRLHDSLSGIATLFGQDDAGAAIAAANADRVGLLLADGSATITLARADGSGALYTSAESDSLSLIAAYVLVRNSGGADQPEAGWYANAIAATNGAVGGAAPWQVPTVQRVDGLLQQTGTDSYQPKAGDTFGLVGGYFTLTQLYPDTLNTTIAQLQQLNPGISLNPPPGTVLTLPVQSHQIVTGDTLAALANRCGLLVTDLAGQQINATAAILTPNCPLVLPAGLRYPVPASSTLQSVAATLGLTLDALAGRLGSLAGLFVTGTPMVLPNARQADVDTLLGQLVGSGQTASVAGMASHFMLHGLRLPMPPDPDGAAIEGLYRITGQQFPAPAQIADAFYIAITADGAPSWAQPVVIHLSVAGETVSAIAAQYGVTVAAILAINPGIDPVNPPATVRVPQPDVEISLDQATLTAQSPDTTFDPAVTAGPEREPLFYAAPVAHSVGPQVPWTAPQPPDLGAAASGGSPSLWRLPASLLAQLASGRVSGDHLLAQSPKGAQAANPPPPVEVWSWATFLPITIRQVATPDAGWLPATYELIGAGQPDRDTLLSLCTSLPADGRNVQLFLAYAGASGGLVSDALTPADQAGRVAVLKANLSTLTSSGAGLENAGSAQDAVPPTATDAYASLAAPTQFVRLVWEASITGSGGFYLNYSTSTGAGLPPATFATGADGQLYLIAVVSDPANPDRALYPHTTGAVIGYNLDPSKVDVFAYAESGDTTVVPIAPPGNIAFSLSRRNPDPGADPDPKTRTQSLFSLLAFQLTGTGFTMPAIALPAGPKTLPVPLPPSSKVPATAGPAGRKGEQQWEYQQIIPVAKLATNPPPELAPGVLPASAGNPYLGIARADGAAGPFLGSSVELSFAFRDVFGNELPADPAIPDVSAPVGYYDPVRGLGSWPAASAHFDITGSSGAAVLTVRLDLGLDKYVPSPANPFISAVRTAAAHQASYGQVFYQLQQPDVSCTITSSLDTPGAAPLVAGDAAERPLRAFVTAAYLYLGSAQAVQQVEYQVGVPEQLSEIAKKYTVTPADLALANASAPVSSLTSAALTIPHEWAVRSSDTLGVIAAAASTTLGTPISVTTLLSNNSQLPLNPGCALPTATGTFTTRPANPAANRPADTFTTVAAALNTAINTLALANAANTGILTTGSRLTIDGVTLTVASSADTLASLVIGFASQGVSTSAGAIATAYANSGLLAGGVPIAVASVPATPGERTGVRPHLVAGGESLDSIATLEQCTLTGLALANAQLAGLLRVGAPVEVKGLRTTVGVDGSLAGLLDGLLTAAVEGGTEVLFGFSDIAQALAKDSTILVANAELALLDYVVQPPDTLQPPVTVASLLRTLPGCTLAQLARLLTPGPPGIYPTGSSLLLSTTTYQPMPGDTLSLVAADFGISIDELAAANSGLLLASGAELAIPGAVTLGATRNAGVYVPMTGAVPTLESLVKATGMQAAAFGLANAGLPDLLVPGVPVRFGGNSTTTTAQSTLASVAAAVHAADAGALVADPGVSAQAGLVAPGALFVSSAPVVTGRSLRGLAGDFGVQLDELATANSAVAGLIAVGIVLTVDHVQVKATATDTLASLARKLQAANPAGQPPIGLADLVAGYADDAGLFAPGAQLLVPPPLVSIAAGVATPYISAPFAPLSAAVTITRDAGLVDPLAAGIASVSADTTRLTANLGPAGRPDQPAVAPGAFARAFETAFADRRLKLATGPQPGDGTERLWIVDFGAPGISAVRLDPGAPRFFALQPMSQQLESGNAEVAQYDPATGTLGAATPKAFGSVDIDSWLRTALEAIDLFLGPAVAAPAWTLNAAGFTSIVEGKQQIADALTGLVQQILTDEVSAAGLADAQQALRQSMLGSLASAYTTDAVVQLPIAVTSPFAPVQVTGPTGATLGQLATGFGVSPPAVAGAFADVPNVLAPGATVQANTRSHLITAQDTLATVSDALGLAGVAQLPVDQTMFSAGTELDLVPMSRAVSADDTFETLAGFFGTDPAAVGTAVQDVVGLLTPGTTIAAGGFTHKVSPADSLATVAAAVQSNAAALAARADLSNDSTLLVPTTPIACFSPLNPIPPRLVGKPVATRYTVPSQGDVASLLALFQVSLQALAEAIAAMGGILTSGVLVGGTHQVVDGDTIRTVGAALVPALDPSGLLTGARNGSVPVTGGSLFRPGAAIALNVLTRTPSAMDSFQSLADYFGQSPADAAVANQDLTGPLAPGIGFSNGQRSYTTTGTETIAYTAGQLGYAGAGEFANDPTVLIRTGIFNPDVALHALQPMPDYSLSSLKVPLTNGTQYASFLFGTAADARYRSLFLDLDLIIDEIEFSVRDVPGAPGYQGSNWLRLPLPLQNSCLDGAVQLNAAGTDVPIALRSYPQLPLVRSLQAQPTWGPPDWMVTTIAEGKQWQLEVNIDHQATAQDDMALTVSFGGPSDALGSSINSVPGRSLLAQSLLSPLAQFTVAWALMQQDVAALSALAPGSNDSRLSSMVGTFALLVQALAAALKPVNRNLGAVPADETYLFNLSTSYDPTGRFLDSVEVSRLSGPTESIPWPAIFVTAGGHQEQLTAQGVLSTQSQRYDYPPGVAAFAPLTHRFVFPGSGVVTTRDQTTPIGLDAVQWQHGNALVSVLRNALLMPGKPTNPSFVYQTPWIGFANPAVPLLVNAAAIQIGTGPSIAVGIQTAIEQLLDGGDQDGSYQLRVLCRYERRLVQGSGAGNPNNIVSPLPVFYVPRAVLQLADLSSFAQSAATQASEWLAQVGLEPSAGDAYVFDLSLYTNDDSQLTRPIIEFSRLRVEVS